MKLKYRKIKKKELESVVDLISRARKPYTKFLIYKEMGAKKTTIKDLTENIHHREFRVLVLNDEIIGFCSYKKKSNDFTWLNNFYIDPKYQRKGYGEEFLNFVEEETKYLSKYLVLEYWPDAVWAKYFYEKNGYREIPDILKSKSEYTKILLKKMSG